MKYIKQQITKDEYEESMNNPTVYKSKIEKNIPIQWSCGYGYYGFQTKEEDGNFFIVHTIGSSCD